MVLLPDTSCRGPIVDDASVAIPKEEAAIVNLFHRNVRERPGSSWYNVELSLEEVRFLFDRVFRRPF